MLQIKTGESLAHGLRYIRDENSRDLPEVPKRITLIFETGAPAL